MEEIPAASVRPEHHQNLTVQPHVLGSAHVRIPAKSVKYFDV